MSRNALRKASDEADGLQPPPAGFDDTVPPLDEHFFENAQVRNGGKIVREATGTLARRGRPPHGDRPKVQQTLRLSAEVLDYFRATGNGWQARIDRALLSFVRQADS